MLESANTTITNALNSQISFYEYPSEKPFINSIYQPLRPSHALSRTVALPESNRDQLLTALQSLTLRIKTLENERERAELNLRQITSDIQRSRMDYKRPLDTSDKQLKKVGQNLPSHQDQCNKSPHSTNDYQYKKTRSRRKIKQTSEENSTGDIINSDGRHFHLDINTVPFILGASTTPSHNVKSNIQNVIALLKTHNHQLCLSSKEYTEILRSNLKNTLSPHTLLHVDYSNKSPKTRPSSVSPIRRPQTATTTTTRRRSYSTIRRPQTSTLSEKQCHSRIKRLHQEFCLLSKEHTRLITSQTNSKESNIIWQRMENILDELEQLQRQLKISSRKSLTKDQFESEINETPLETLRKTRKLQSILKNSTNKQQQQPREYSRRTRSNSND